MSMSQFLVVPPLMISNDFGVPSADLGIDSTPVQSMKSSTSGVCVYMD